LEFRKIVIDNFAARYDILYVRSLVFSLIYTPTVLSLTMVKINLNDFLDILSNGDVKTKLEEIFTVSLNKSAQTVMDKIDGLNATIIALKVELTAKDAIIEKVQRENQQLQKSVKDLIVCKENLQQETKRDNIVITGFKPTFAEASAEGSDNADVPQSSVIDKVVNLCRGALEMPEFNSRDVSSAYFLPAPKPNPGRTSAGPMMIVRFMRRAIRDEVLSKRRLLKAYNRDNNTAYFVNEDLILPRRKLFSEARKALKNGKLDGAWTAAGLVRVKLSSGRKVTINTIAELNDLLD
jgi:hypothetical protein